MECKALKFRMNLWFCSGDFGPASLTIPQPNSFAFLGPCCLDGQLRNFGHRMSELQNRRPHSGTPADRMAQPQADEASLTCT